MRTLFTFSCLFPAVFTYAAPAVGDDVLAHAGPEPRAQQTQVNKDTLDTRELLLRRNSYYFALRAARDLGEADVATDAYGKPLVDGPGSVAPHYQGSFRVQLNNGKECLINRDRKPDTPRVSLADETRAPFWLRCSKRSEE